MRKSAYAIPYTALYLDRPAVEQDYPLMVRDLPREEKPREKLASHGPEALTARELLAVVLQVGTVKEEVMEMADRVVRSYGESGIFSEKDPERLAKEADIPLAKACQIVAIGEFGRRAFEKSETGFTVIRNAKDVFDYLAEMRFQHKESMRGLFLNARNRVIRNEVISIGTVDSNLVHPREVFRSGLESNAVAVVLAHNHPSGDVEPSSQDVEVTKRLIEAGKLIGIRVLDHVIIAKDAFASVKADY
ncbi:MAG: DNA repair protein RadC [Patescibacteria group bacterium]|nr:DNA repair protein RadC [Patescibacteria group bacterium]